jgi:hypothetical protein
MRDIKKYEVFKKSHEMVVGIYRLTKDFPKEEMFGITYQMYEKMEKGYEDIKRMFFRLYKKIQ